MRFIFAFLVFGLPFLFTNISTQSYASSSVKITEFVAIATEGPDWVEIYNSSASTVSLEGWKIRDSTDSNKKNLTGCISAKGFRKFDFSNKLNNSGDEIRLFDKNDILIDSLSYFSAAVPSHQKGESTGRNPDTEDSWQVITTPTPADSSCKIQTTYLKLSLSEIFPNPQKGEKEWVEIYNPNSTKIDLNGWNFIDSANHKKEMSGAISAKSYQVFYFSSGWLNNQGDSVKLIDPNGKHIENYTYSKIEKDFALAKNLAGAWKITSTPTPGKTNKITADLNSSSTGNGEVEENSPEILESTGLQATVDFISDSFQTDFPTATPAGKVAGISEGGKSSNTLTTLLISAGIAFFGTAIAWPFLERKGLV